MRAHSDSEIMSDSSCLTVTPGREMRRETESQNVLSVTLPHFFIFLDFGLALTGLTALEIFLTFYLIGESGEFVFSLSV